MLKTEAASSGKAVVGRSYEVRSSQGVKHENQLAIHERLILSVNGGHGIFAILDRRDSSFQHNILDTCRVRAPGGMLAINLQLDVQAVVVEQDVCQEVL